jgi:hypothetical protein
MDATDLRPGWCLDAGIERFAMSLSAGAPRRVTGQPAWRRGPFALGVTDRQEALAILQREVQQEIVMDSEEKKNTGRGAPLPWSCHICEKPIPVDKDLGDRPVAGTFLRELDGDGRVICGSCVIDVAVSLVDPIGAILKRKKK